MAALRIRNLDFPRKIITVDIGRMPGFGGIEAEPKTGPREVDCSYDAEIFSLLVKLRDARDDTRSPRLRVTDPSGQPLSQEWLRKRVWLPTLERARLRTRR